MSGVSKNLIFIIGGPVVGLVAYMVFQQLQPDAQVSKMAGITLWMAVWWISEAVPLAITALLPVFLFPLFGIMGTKALSPSYMNQILFLFIGGFIIAFAMEKWNLHKRIALKIILLIGNDVNRILLGMMVASWFLSMWISNTATTMMLLPTALAVIQKLKDYIPTQDAQRKFSIGVLLGIAYAASIGGTATLIGTPPNLIFISQYQTSFPEQETISFMQWFLFGLPASCVLLGGAYLLLKRWYCPKDVALKSEIRLFEQEYASLGRMSFEEKVVAFDFIVLALLWFFRKDLNLGLFTLPGWDRLVEQPQYFTDSTVAVFMAVLLFLIPSRQKPGEKIISWQKVKELPYDIILLFGGGFALAKGFTESGLSVWLSGQLDGIVHLSPLLIIACICFFMTFLTEITSNMATTQLMLPVLVALSAATGIDPLLLMLPATFSASMAFMLPVATAPNAIIFGSHQLQIADMARTGLVLNLICIGLMTLLMFTLGRWVFGIG